MALSDLRARTMNAVSHLQDFVHHQGQLIHHAVEVLRHTPKLVARLDRHVPGELALAQPGDALGQLCKRPADAPHQPAAQGHASPDYKQSTQEQRDDKTVDRLGHFLPSACGGFALKRNGLGQLVLYGQRPLHWCSDLFLVDGLVEDLLGLDARDHVPYV